MDFKNFKDRFNAQAAKLRGKARDVGENLKVAGAMGVVLAAVQLDRAKEALFPSFWTSIEKGDAAAVEKALQKNPALANETLSDDLTTPLHYAASCEQAGVAEVLLKHGAKLDAEDHRGITPLLIASSRGHLPTIELFLQNNDPTLNRLVFQETETAVSAAASNGHADALEMLHKGGARLDIATDRGETALTETQSRLEFAQKQGRADDVLKLTNCLDYLTRHMGDVCTGADRNANIYTSLMRVARDGDVDLAEMMLAADTCDTVNQRFVSEERAIPVHGNNDMNHSVNTALKESVLSREPAMVEILLKHGAKQAIDYEGDMTPLMMAAWQKRPEMLKTLLANDASTIDLLHLRKYDGFLTPKRVDFTHSALTYAVKSKSAEMVSLLLDHGARADLPTTQSPRQMAQEAGLDGIVAILDAAEAAREKAEIERQHKTTAPFRDGLDVPITAGKPLTLKSNRPEGPKA